jgi:methyltransferase (TIGR00027 family)
VSAPGVVEGVADTAFLVAAFRAQESERDDALFRDPFAARLVGARREPMLAAVAHLGAMASWSSVVRTALIDRLIEEAAARGVRTVVNLGAGLDTRPYRLALPSTLAWIEIDQAAVVAHKNAALAGDAPRCKLERVAADLTDVSARRAVFARVADRPALALAEGLFPYFNDDVVGDLLDDMTAIDELIVDYLAPEVIRARSQSTKLHDVPFQFVPDNWAAFFASHGWKVKAMHDLADEGERRGRPFPVPDDVRAQMAQAGVKRGTFAAYAVMERA